MSERRYHLQAIVETTEDSLPDLESTFEYRLNGVPCVARVHDIRVERVIETESDESSSLVENLTNALRLCRPVTKEMEQLISKAEWFLAMR